MKKLRQFSVFVKDKPGSLAGVTRDLSKYGINITSINVDRYGMDAALKIVTSNEMATRNALKEGGYEFEESIVLVVPIQNKVGELAKLSEKLYKSNINIRSISLLSDEKTIEGINLLFDLSDIEKGEAVLQSEDK